MFGTGREEGSTANLGGTTLGGQLFVYCEVLGAHAPSAPLVSTSMLWDTLKTLKSL